VFVYDLALLVYFLWVQHMNFRIKMSLCKFTPCSLKGKGKLHPRTGHEGPEGE